MEKVIIRSPLQFKTMSNTSAKPCNVDTSVDQKAPFTEVLNHIDMEMKQQADELAGKALVSHVPVSIVIDSRSSSSTLCSLSSKEGSESGDTLSPSSTTRLSPFNEINKTKELEAVPSQFDSQGSTQSEKILSPPKASNFHSTKVSVASAESKIQVSPESAPSITSRPAKKPRTISTCSSKATKTFTSDASEATKPQDSSLLLLAQDEDDEHLTPLHVFVRKQIEVFTATHTELSQPAPGRKQPIQLHQVGLRCIHCRNVASLGGRKTRVKRAVCYPSAVGRIYHSVSDMKFDHFSHCQHIPQEVRTTFEKLKAEGKDKKGGKNNKGTSSSSTAKYYRESAAGMGLVDGPGGVIYMSNKAPGQSTTPQHPTSSQKVVSTPAPAPCVPLLQPPTLAQTLLQQQFQQDELAKLLIQQQSLASLNSAAVASMLFPPLQMPNLLSPSTSPLANAMNSTLLQSLLMNAVAAGANAQKSIDAAVARAEQQHKAASQSPERKSRKRPLESITESIVVPLAAAEDANDLNPLHCFVRKHVELFSATKADTEAPCPGRKTRVTLGQVGIRCKHCARLNLKPRQRVKRAVCYPPSIDGIYHSVSNMKFDHFGICPSLPEEAKKELEGLRASYSGRNIGSTNTARYYRDSAVSKGLVDTEKGIRFQESVSQQQQQQQAPMVPQAAAPTGISALMMAAATHATSI